MEYLINNNRYTISYQQLKEKYTEFCEMSNRDFKLNLSSALHLACVICWFKEIPTRNCLDDEGIIHQLIHLLDIPDEPLIDINIIREQFKNDLKLD